MASVRPSWQGHLRLSLVSCPVMLFPATEENRVSFHRLSRQSHNRLRQRMVDPETGEAVEREDQILGYEYERGKYALVEPHEREDLRIDSSKIIDIERFVEGGEIDRLYWGDPYYMVPDGPFAQEAFAVIREAAQRKGMVGLGRVVIVGRERPVAIEPRGKGMVVTRLRAANEVRNPAEFFDPLPEVDLNKELLGTAKKIVERKEAAFDPATFEDRYQLALRKLVEAKIKGTEPVMPKIVEPRDTKVVDLFETLRRSLDESAPAPKKPAAKPAAAAHRAPKRKSA